MKLIYQIYDGINLFRNEQKDILTEMNFDW